MFAGLLFDPGDSCHRRDAVVDPDRQVVFPSGSPVDPLDSAEAWSDDRGVNGIQKRWWRDQAAPRTARSVPEVAPKGIVVTHAEVCPAPYVNWCNRLGVCRCVYVAAKPNADKVLCGLDHLVSNACVA
jgi:hypothetical protein